MFNKIFDNYNPKEISSHSILKFFAEDLTENQKNDFITALFNNGCWILPIEIANLSGSEWLRNESKIKFKTILKNWVNDRIEHSISIPSNIKNPHIPSIYISEYREILLAIKSLQFPDEIMKVYFKLFSECTNPYFKKLVEKSFWLVIEEYEVIEIEKYFIKFLDASQNNESLNTTYYMYSFLNKLVYSFKIFNLSPVFINKLSVLSKKLNDLNNKTDFNVILSLLLIELIEKKKLDLSDSRYKNLIIFKPHEIGKGDYENISYLKFLRDFNYSFDGCDFILELNGLIDNLNSQIFSINNSDDTHKKASLHHFVKSADQYFELFLFILEKCPDKNREELFIQFVECVDVIRNSFKSSLWFDEYLNIKPLYGKIDSIENRGFYVKLDDEIVKDKITNFTTIDIPEDDFQLNYGFLSDVFLSDFPKSNPLYSNLGSNTPLDEKNLIVEKSKSLQSEAFLISDLNYSKSNKGTILILCPVTKNLINKISKYELKALFSSLEILLIEIAYDYLNLPSPFRKNSSVLKKFFDFKFRDYYCINFPEETFKKIFEKLRPTLFETIYLGQKKADEAFKILHEAHNNNIIVEGIIKSKTSGGMTIDIQGIEAFLPGSQMGNKLLFENSDCIGKQMCFKIIKASPITKNIVLSHKQILDDKSQETLSSLQIGQLISGKVKNITSYGVFISLGDVDGLIHLTDLSYNRISKPENIVSLGQEITVKILEINYETKHVFLGLKQLSKDPWENIDEKLKSGDKITGRVVSEVSYGMFVEIYPGINGLIHKNDLKYSYNNQLNKRKIKIGDSVTTLIESIDILSRRISLSLSKLTEIELTNIINEKYPADSVHVSILKSITKYGYFVELEKGINGFIHLGRNKPQNVKIGHNIKVTVIEYNKSRRNMELALFNPWQDAESKYYKGSKHIGIVKMQSQFGVIVELEENLTCIIPISQFKKSEKFKRIPETKENILVKVSKIDSFNKKIHLEPIV